MDAIEAISAACAYADLDEDAAKRVVATAISDESDLIWRVEIDDIVVIVDGKKCEYY
jgi:hypothetical protein